MYAIVFSSRVEPDTEERGMRTRLRWPVLMVIAALLLAACGKDSDSTPAAAPSQATTACASSGELTMWERSGGNKQMVDMLVAAWNTKNPNCRIKLTYIPHTEMVGKIAQGIASGEVPDLMGMDLIYAPQFEKAQQLVDLTDRIGAWPELKTASKGAHDGRHLREPGLRRAAVRGRVGALLQQGPVPQGRARPRQAPHQPRRA